MPALHLFLCRRAVVCFATIATCVCAVCLPAIARADPTTDPAGDFLPSYDPLLPRGGDLDVLASTVTLLPSGDFVFEATFAAPVGTTTATGAGSVLYVWGIDRGAGTVRFPAIADQVRFDSVVLLRPDGTGNVNRLTPAGAGGNALSAGSVSVSGNSITGIVPGSFLPSQGFAPEQYTWNLWPRFGAGNNNQISDFAPDNRNVTVSVVPEPGAVWTAAAFALPLTAALLRGRRRRVDA